MDNIYKQLDFTDHMEPITRAYHAAMEAQLEGEVLKACYRIGIEVDKDRLMQALTDARKFFDEGWQKGYEAGRAEGKFLGRQIERAGEEAMCVRTEGGMISDGHWRPYKKYCPVCGKQQKNSKHGLWYCERCGQKLCREEVN